MDTLVTGLIGFAWVAIAALLLLGVVDGFPPKGLEGDADIAARHAMLRQFGYKR